MLKPAVSKFRPDLSTRLTDIAEKQVSAKLKPIVAPSHVTALLCDTAGSPYQRCAPATWKCVQLPSAVAGHLLSDPL